MPDQIHTARCFCGAIVAEMRGDPFWVCFDHDDDCRRAIGAPIAMWVGFRPQQVRSLQGSPNTFSKTEGVVRSFCGTCGSSIGYTDTGIEDEQYFAIGFFDEPERLKPQAHAYYSMKLPCLHFADDLEKTDTYSRERDQAVGTPAERAK